MNKKRIAFYAGLVCLAGCIESNLVEHPQVSQFPKDQEVNQKMDLEHPVNATALIEHISGIGTYKFSIGEDSIFDPRYSFDWIPPKMDMDHNGWVYVVQNYSHSINVYDPEGIYQYSIGREGRGPGEFIRIHSFVFDASFNTLYVLDYNDIEVFTRSDGSFKYESTIQSDFIRTTNLCLIDSTLFVTGHRIARDEQKSVSDGIKRQGEATALPPIQRLDLTGKSEPMSFGFVYESVSGWGFLNNEMSRTVLSCNSKTKTVIGIMSHFPYVFGYDLDGNRKWISKIEGYKSTMFTEEKTAEGPSFYQFTNSDFLHFKLPVPASNLGEFAVFQYLDRVPQDFFAKEPGMEIKERRYYTIFIHSNTGELTYSDEIDLIGSISETNWIHIQQEYKHPTMMHVYGKVE